MDEIILNNIKLLACIKPGDTICSSGLDLVVLKHDRYFTSLLRTFSGESRIKTLEYIRVIMNTLHQEKIAVPVEVKTGLENIKKTYNKDSTFKREIDRILHNIEWYTTAGTDKLTRRESSDLFFSSN